MGIRIKIYWLITQVASSNLASATKQTQCKLVIEALGNEGFFVSPDPSCPALTPFSQEKGKADGIRREEDAAGLHAGF